MQNDQVTFKAASVAFFLILAVFPGIIFFFTLIPYIPIDGFQETIFIAIRSVLPDSIFFVVQPSVEDIINKQRFGLLSIGFALAFFFSASGVKGIMNSFGKNDNTFRKRSWVNKNLVAMKITFYLTFLMLLSVAMVITGKYLIRHLADALDIETAFGFFVLGFVRWITLILIFFFSISTIYYYGPAMEQRWRFFSVGAAVATAFSLLFSLGFTLFVNSFDVYNRVFGSIGTMLAVMLWFYLNSLMLLIGFEVNYSIALHKTEIAGKLEEWATESD